MTMLVTSPIYPERAYIYFTASVNPAKRGFHQRLFSRAFGPAVSTSIAVCQIGALEQLHSASALAVACILPG